MFDLFQSPPCIIDALTSKLLAKDNIRPLRHPGVIERAARGQNRPSSGGLHPLEVHQSYDTIATEPLKSLIWVVISACLDVHEDPLLFSQHGWLLTLLTSDYTPPEHFTSLLMIPKTFSPRFI